jgi:hypothetical protein
MGNSASGLHHRGAVDGMKCLLDQLIACVAIEVEKVDHRLRADLLHFEERVLDRDAGAVRLRQLGEKS